MNKLEEMEQVISRLQIIHTWATVDGMRGTGIDPKCCKDVAQWTQDAIDRLREQAEALGMFVSTCQEQEKLLGEVCQTLNEFDDFHWWLAKDVLRNGVVPYDTDALIRMLAKFNYLVWDDGDYRLNDASEAIDIDTCYECSGYGDDYYLDDDGELQSACDDCIHAYRRSCDWEDE